MGGEFIMTRNGLTKFPMPRSGFDTVSVYDGDTGACHTDLSDNTNLWGMSPSAKLALEKFPYGEARRYPSAYSAQLRESLARYVGADPAMIVTGCGSDDVLDAAIRAYGNLGGTLTCCDPTFSMIPVLARINGLKVKAVSFEVGGNLQIEDMLSGKSDIIYVCSPNNPTGTSVGLDRITCIAEEFDGLVIVDQAYAEYSAASITSPLTRYHNVLVTRTMSKAFGMAGLRVGYAVGHPLVIGEVEKSRGPYKVGSLASAAAVAAIENDQTWVASTVAETLANRSRLVSRLEGLGYKPLPSDANFILVPASGAPAIAARMVKAGVAVRAFADLTEIGPALRITVGPWDMMETFLSTFEGSLQ